MAHIQRRGRRWRARYVGLDGREYSQSFDRKVDAVRYLADIEARKLRREWVDPSLGRITFAEWSSEWLNTAVYSKPKTRAGHESLLRVHLVPAFGDEQLGRITPLLIRRWAAEHSGTMSASRLRQAYFLLSKVMRAAVESGYLLKTPCVGIDLPRNPHRDMLYLDAVQVSKLAEVINPAFRTMVLVLAYGGLRWGEACAVRRKRVDIGRCRIEVAESLWEVGSTMGFGETKTYQRRTVVLPSFLQELLTDQLVRVPADSEALVFTDSKGRPLRNSSFHRQVWSPGVKAAGLPPKLRIHDLRHTCAALLIANGAHPKEVQAHLGHSSITVSLDRYGHLFPESLENLADRLDETYKKTRRPPDGQDETCEDLRQDETARNMPVNSTNAVMASAALGEGRDL